MKLAILAAALFAWAAPALASADKVHLNIKVVEASTQGNGVDPKLKHMQADFKQKGFAYSSYKLVGEVSPVLGQGQSAEVSLPSGKKAKLTLQKVQASVPVQPGEPKINMHIFIPDVGADVDYSVGNRGTYFQGAGPAAGGGQVFLIIQHTAQ